MDAIDLREIHRQLEELRIRCDYIEGNQRNAESGTTACSSRQDAALVEENRTFQPTGNPAELIEELRTWAENRIESHPTNKGKYRSNVNIAIHREMTLLLEKLSQMARRRGC